MKNLITLPTLVLAIAFLMSCQPLKNKVSNSAKQEPPVGRYQMLSVATKTLKLDTATGETWSLDSDSIWRPLTNADSNEKTRIIAEFAVEAWMAKEEFNPRSRKYETITEAEKKQMVDAAVKYAFSVYGHPETPEQLRRIHGTEK